MDSKYVLSFGAGVNSTALMIYLVKNKMPFDGAVFADTGGELEDTYQNVSEAESYLKQHEKFLKIVSSKNGTLYETCKRRKVIPSQIWRWSTRDYKVTPIHAYYRSLNAHIYEYLGICYDEIERIKPSRETYITSLFPLVEAKLSRIDCIKLIREAGLRVPPKSGCYFCPFNTNERWQYIYTNHHAKYLKAMRLEESSKHFPDQKLHKLTLRVLKDRRFKNGHAKDLSDNPCGAYCMV